MGSSGRRTLAQLEAACEESKGLFGRCEVVCGDSELSNALRAGKACTLGGERRMSKEDVPPSKEDGHWARYWGEGVEVRSCINLGTTYAKGEGVIEDDAKALALYQKACDGGNERGCNLAEGMRPLAKPED